MSGVLKKTFKSGLAWVGLFVTIALLIFLVFLIALGGGGLWGKRQVTYSVLLNKSVKGLSVGAPLMLRGVRIGEVTDIQMTVQKVSRCPAAVDGKEKADGKVDKKGAELVAEQYSYPIQVFFEIDPEILREKSLFSRERGEMELVKKILGDSQDVIFGSRRMHRMVSELVKNHGLRASLQMISYLTGQLCIELDFYDALPPLTKEETLALARHILPIRQSTIEQLQAQFDNAKVTKMLSTLQNTLAVWEQFVSQGKFAECLNRFHKMSGDLEQSADAMSKVLKKTEQVLEQVNGLSGDSRGLVKNADTAVQQVKQTMEGVNQSLEEMERTGQSLRALSEMLQRQPEALLQGR